ncbi:hypothetical protein CGCF415_v000485 [Colletotrichum fructicola]|uniref:Uncharacterized protein n=1 Tax=Colletotrichum fructicola (strain Nara gc5) TaxID=1213859 RepID=L2FYM4_COLFN|nr:uncharacterized protein CGMCC3_g8190 [Colletotrichum fructicola]KAF4486148.1 hypothetical protein CGGC5_v005413 [Colletotrichum fructicola Nara gc5]KAE9575971.1 hypothetical protein CGMCC3_g8190 [Colletotrichum fructicola]KAF4423986.1 hypothetical protein CFRS1_v006634 [Colletotrichum fructicola]KAF4885438.1 hypothetical protein CGCFRS4_v011948 [Colletotrichum fructicola]KAF4916687.1 hypothetical protein CGCF415_v000485 [Colletotrichum fructicola]
MEEPDHGSDGRQLRRSTLAHQPGRYAEMLVAGVERPAFTVPDPVFDPEPARHCAFPTIELDQHPGPSEQFIEARARGDLHGDNHPLVQYSDSDNDQGDNQGERRALVAHLPPLDAGDDEIMRGIEEQREEKNDIQTTGELRTPKRGESFKEFCLAVTNDLDWGSPEPEPEPEPQQQIDEGPQGELESRMDGTLQSEFDPDSWDSIGTGAQWAILSTLCQAHKFSVAVHRLNLTTDQITTFIQTYIKCHEEIQDWCRKIDRIPVFDLIRRAEDGLHSVDEYVNLARPRLPTDILFQHEIELAGAFLRKSGHPELVHLIDKWRGTSTNFVELPINQDMLSYCRVKLYMSRGSNRVQDFQPIEDQEPELWLKRLREPEDFNNGVCHFYKYYGNPYALNVLDPLLPQQQQLDANRGVPIDPSFVIERDESGRALENVSGRPLLDYREPTGDEQQQLSVEQTIAHDLAAGDAHNRPRNTATLNQQEFQKTAGEVVGVAAPTKTSNAAPKQTTSSRIATSHRPRLFNKPAPGQQYTSLAARRGTGSYTSPFILDASESPESQPGRSGLDAVVEESEPAHFEQTQVDREQTAAHESAEVHSEAGNVLDPVPNQAPLEASGVEMSYASQPAPKSSRKRACDDSDDEYEPYDDGQNDDEYLPPAKKPRKANTKKPNARNKTMPAAQQARQSKQTKRQSKQTKRQPKQVATTMAKTANQPIPTAPEAFHHELAHVQKANQAGFAPNLPVQAAQSEMNQYGTSQLSNSENNLTPSVVPQPVKRGRGRPRKYPRSEDLAARGVGAQPSGSQEPGNAAGAQLPTTKTTSKPTVTKTKKKSPKTQSDPDASALTASAETFGPSSSSENSTAPAPTTMESSAELTTGNQSQVAKPRIKIKNSKGQTGQKCSPVPPPVLPPQAMPASQPQNCTGAQMGHISYSQLTAQSATRTQSRPAQALSPEHMEYHQRNKKSAHEAAFRPEASVHNSQVGFGYSAYRNTSSMPFEAAAATGTSMQVHQTNAHAGGQSSPFGVASQHPQARPQYVENRLGSEAGHHQAPQATSPQTAVQPASQPVQFPSVLRTVQQQVKNTKKAKHATENSKKD